MCMQRHSTFNPLVAVFKFVANRDRSQKVANAVLAYLRAFSYLRLDFVRSRTQALYSFLAGTASYIMEFLKTRGYSVVIKANI